MFWGGERAGEADKGSACRYGEYKAKGEKGRMIEAFNEGSGRGQQSVVTLPAALRLP